MQGIRGQSETLGVVLILGMTLLSVGAIATMGGTAIDRTQQSVDVQSAGHALSQLDSEVSLVALSRVDRQSVALGRGRQGTYTVFPDRGRITITHINSTPGNDTELYNATMGELQYETGDTILAYQGGGVWRSQGGNGSVMVSAPEFHYRKATLTLPIIKVKGDGSVAGSATADIVDESPGIAIYPNRSQTYPVNGRQYINPVQNGTIEIKIQSQFYEGWGTYFRERTDGEVSTYSSNKTAVLSLVSTGLHGAFDMPLEGQPMDLVGVGGGHPLHELNVTIQSDQPNSQEFSGLSWSISSQEGSKKFELTIGSGQQKNCGDPVPVSVYYSNGTAEQGWHSDSAFTVQCVGGTDPYIEANLTSDAPVNYTDLATSDLTRFKANDDFANPVNFSQHGDTVSWEDPGKVFHEGDQTTLGNVTNHYIGLMGENVALRVTDGHGNGGGASGSVNEKASAGYIDYGSTGKYVTYLHVSENEVNLTVR